MRVPTLLATLLLVGLPLVHPSIAQPTTAQPTTAQPTTITLATLATSYDDLLPARMALLSASHAGNLPEHTVLTLLTTPGVPLRHAEDISQRDRIDHVRLPDRDVSFPLFSLFRLPYRKVLYISAYTLATASLAPLFHCPNFCASFITPCSFSESLMLLTPNDTTYTALKNLAQGLDTHSSPCNPTPDWLSPEACILNHHFGKQLLNSPLFHLDKIPNNATIEITNSQQLRRLPMGCHVPHYLYYPRLRWEVPQSSCGVRRAVNFQSPSLLRPWYWWTYMFMDLSWEWRAHRLQLIESDSIRSDRLVFIARFFFLVLVSAAAMFAAFNSFDAGRWENLNKKPRKDSTVAEPVLVLYVVTIGWFACIISWVVAFVATPPMLALPLALPLAICYHVAAEFFLWLALGCLFIRHHANETDSRRAKSERRAALETFLMVGVEMVFLVSAVRLANGFSAQTMFQRIGCFVVAGIGYVGVVLWLLGRLCMVWVSVGVREGLS